MLGLGANPQGDSCHLQNARPWFLFLILVHRKLCQRRFKTFVSCDAALVLLSHIYSKEAPSLVRPSSLSIIISPQESELAELRETIEMLKTQNTDAQTAIQVALNGPDHLHKGNEETSRGCWATLKSSDVPRRPWMPPSSKIIGCIFSLIGPRGNWTPHTWSVCAAEVSSGKLRLVMETIWIRCVISLVRWPFQIQPTLSWIPVFSTLICFSAKLSFKHLINLLIC